MKKETRSRSFNYRNQATVDYGVQINRDIKRFLFIVLWTCSFTATGSDWAHNAISLTHQYGDGSGVKVGVMDGATRCTHQELAGRCFNTFWLDTWGGHSNHGTHVATIIGGQDKAPDWLEHDGGVAPGAEIFSYEVFDPYDWWISDEHEIFMADKAASDGVSVINQSYGTYDEKGMPYLVENMLDVWRKHKYMTFVNAAGNEGVVLDPGSHDDIENVIFVGATNQQGKITYWSNRPGEHYKHQFIVAPGDYISGGFSWSDSDYGWMSGTSMAAPIVTGAVALLHSYWGHLKNNPVATANILYESATDLGAKGVDVIYGHGLLNIKNAFDPLAIVADPGNGGDIGDSGDAGDDCNDTILDDPFEPSYPIGTPGDGIWYDARGHQHRSRGIPRNGFRDCHLVDNPPIDDEDGDDWDSEHCGWWCDVIIGTPGDGIWYDSRGKVNYFAYERNGIRHVLERAKVSPVLAKSASKLTLVFFDKYGRAFRTNATSYQAVSRVLTEYLNINKDIAVQLVSGNKLNFKIGLPDSNLVIGHGRTLGFESNPVLAMLDDGVFIANDRIGVMSSDTAITALYKPADWLTMTYTKEDGLFGSRGLGKYDTAAATISKDTGMFFGSTTIAVSKGGNDRGIVQLSDTVSSMAFEAGVRGKIKDSIDWKFTVSKGLTTVGGTMTVLYDDRYGQNINRTVSLRDYTDTKLMFNISYTW